MLRIKFYVLLISFVLVVTACGSPAATPLPETVHTEAPVILPTEIPPTPTPDTAVNASVVESPELVDITFTTAQAGWGVTETQIIRTQDGGTTWHNVTPTNVTAAGYNAHLSMLDNDHVWVAITDFAKSTTSSDLYRTVDGGLTWATFTAPFASGNITFLDENNGWAFGDLGAGAGSEAIAIFQTNDGGANWAQTYTNDPSQPGAGDSLPLGGIKSGLTPLNMQTAWVGGIVYSDGTVYLYRTDDAGANWQQVTTLPLPPEAQATQISFSPPQFVSAQDAFLVMDIPSDQIQSVIYVTHDAGNTWTMTPTFIPNGWFADFVSATDGFMYTGEQFYVTHDAAVTWSTITPDVAFGDSVYIIDFVDASTGWVLTADSNNHRSLYQTLDGGFTWSSVIP